MPSFNKVMLIGNLTREPLLKPLGNGSSVCEFGIATNRKFRTSAGEDKEETTFIDCNAFGKQADVIKQYCTKGKPLFVEGRLHLEQWQDKQGGGLRSKLTVTVENFQFLGGRDEAGGGDRQQQNRQPAGASRGGGGQDRGPFPPARSGKDDSDWVP